MNIDEIPTPETDAAFKQWLLESDKSHRIRMRSKMRDFERRLTIARETLWGVHDTSSSSRLRRVAKEALALTAPKP